jgi:AcrR family transcriptional regulator
VARPKASEQRDTASEIVAAALDLFAERGFHGTSIRDIARVVGVRESAIYHHFESKEGLFDAVLFAPGEDDRPLLGPPRLPRFEGEASELPAFFEAQLWAVSERFVSVSERKRFKIMLSDGLRLAAQGKVDYFARILALRQPLIDQMEDLRARGLLRGDSAEMLAIEFAAPMLAWRHMIALMPTELPVPDRGAFLRAHAQHFLRGAMVDSAAVIDAPTPSGSAIGPGAVTTEEA